MRAVVVAGGELTPSDVALLDGADLMVAADGGAAALDALGGTPHLLVGDLDSIKPAAVARLEAGGTRVERHPSAKDASDAELAIDRAAAAGADRIDVVGALGGPRFDHELATLLLLADPAWSGRDLRIVRGGVTVRALHTGERVELDGRAGDLVSLLPVAGDAAGVHTQGLRWPLDGETLRMGRSRGLSNEVAEVPASVQLASGTLLVIETAAGGSRP